MSKLARLSLCSAAALWLQGSSWCWDTLCHLAWWTATCKTGSEKLKHSCSSVSHRAKLTRQTGCSAPLLAVPVFWKSYECALPLYMQQILFAHHKELSRFILQSSCSVDGMCKAALDSLTVPDHPGVGRWCKQCKSYQPLENFPAGRRQYKCKQHCWSSAKARYDALASKLSWRFPSACQWEINWILWALAYCMTHLTAWHTNHLSHGCHHLSGMFRREELFRQNPGKHALWMMWHYSYMDSKLVFHNKACVSDTGGD